jgi:hypothetical protein
MKIYILLLGALTILALTSCQPNKTETTLATGSTSNIATQTPDASVSNKSTPEISKSEISVTPTPTPSASEQPLNVELRFLRVDDPRGKYLVQSVFQWNGGSDGFYVESISISYRDDSLEEVFEQSWTAGSIKQAWGNSSYISSGATKNWPVNVYLDGEINKITMIYNYTIRDIEGHIDELSITKSAQVSD